MVNLSPCKAWPSIETTAYAVASLAPEKDIVPGSSRKYVTIASSLFLPFYYKYYCIIMIITIILIRIFIQTAWEIPDCEVEQQAQTWGPNILKLQCSELPKEIRGFWSSQSPRLGPYNYTTHQYDRVVSLRVSYNRNLRPREGFSLKPPAQNQDNRQQVEKEG